MTEDAAGKRQKLVVARLFLLAACSLSLLALLLPDVTHAETPDEYRSALADTLRAAETAAAASPPYPSLGSDPVLAASMERLRAIGEVTVAPGAGISVDNSGLLRGLAGTREEGQQAIVAVRQLIAALDGNRGQYRPEGRTALDEVLTRPEFHAEDGNPVTRFIDNARELLIRWLAERGLTLPAPPDVPAGDTGHLPRGWLEIILALAIMAGLGFAVWSGRRSLTRYAAQESEARANVADALSAKHAAEMAAENGDFRLAIHYVLHWALLRLAEQSRLSYDPSLTNREQLRGLEGDAQTRERLTLAIATFDRLWYGHAPCAAPEYLQFRSHLEHVVG